jgi:hypothetical protein
MQPAQKSIDELHLDIVPLRFSTIVPRKIPAGAKQIKVEFKLKLSLFNFLAAWENGGF